MKRSSGVSRVNLIVVFRLLLDHLLAAMFGDEIHERLALPFRSIVRHVDVLVVRPHGITAVSAEREG